jgi:hypothetical protein
MELADTIKNFKWICVDLVGGSGTDGEGGEPQKQPEGGGVQQTKSPRQKDKASIVLEMRFVRKGEPGQ